MLNWVFDFFFDHPVHFLKSIAQVNCMAVADAELGSPVRIPIELLEAGRLDEHWCDKKHRHMAVIGEDGEHVTIFQGDATIVFPCSILI